MTPDQFDLFLKHQSEQIEKTIRVVVNGKIDKIDRKLDDYIIQDNEWKNKAQPTIDMGNNARGFGKVVVYILSVGAALFTILKFFNK